MPTFVLGHSMGGLITAYGAAYVFPQFIQGIALSSPCFGLTIDVPPSLAAIARILAWTYPHYSFKTRTVSALLSHDREIVKKHEGDEKLVRLMSARLFYCIEKTMKQSANIARGLRVPCAIFQAGDDHVVSPQAAKDFHHAMGQKTSFYKEYPDLYHEILQEVEREAVYDDILRWLNDEIS